MPMACQAVFMMKNVGPITSTKISSTMPSQTLAVLIFAMPFFSGVAPKMQRNTKNAPITAIFSPKVTSVPVMEAYNCATTGVPRPIVVQQPDTVENTAITSITGDNGSLSLPRAGLHASAIDQDFMHFLL